MQQYRELISDILLRGEERKWRNGHTGISIFDARMEFDLREGFPLEGLKKVPFKTGVVGELIGFIRGYTNAADFRALGCNVWNQNANEEPSWLNNPARKGHDDLGRIYGAQWRDIRVQDGGSYAVVDQLWQLLAGLRSDPHGRRHVVSAWNPAELHLMALPPCHMFFQCYVSNDGHLDLKMYQRSADAFLGIPFNIASYATLMHILAHFCNLVPRRLIMDLGDAHLYTNQIDLAHEMLKRSCPELPDLELNTDGWESLMHIQPDDFALNGYRPHAAMNCEMAV